MLKIRLMRIGAKKKPFYRVVAVDERSKRTGGYIELLGTYNPLTEPKEIKLKQDRIDYWIKQGAQLSTGYLRITGKAPQRPPRKPKKPARNASQSDAGGEKKIESSAVSPQSSEKPEETQSAEPAPIETPTQEAPAAEQPQEAPAQETTPAEETPAQVEEKKE